MPGVEISIVTETYNYNEGGDGVRLRGALRALSDLAGAAGIEVLLADVCGDPALARSLLAECPGLVHVDAAGRGYDDAKMMAVRRASGRYVLFLDGDCRPSPEWLESLSAPLRRGAARACAGLTRYEGGFAAAVATVLDFGFLYPASERSLKCYASNNCGFLRQELLDEPIPAGFVRCRCYLHAQRLARRGSPVQLVPGARVRHELQPLVRERTRQGYDVIASCWTDPDAPEARWLRLGPLCLGLFYAARVVTDWRRVLAGRRELGLSLGQALLALPLFPALRLLDLAGMAQALATGRRLGGWPGFLAAYRHSAPCAE